MPAGVVAGDVMLAVITKNVQTIGTTSPPGGWTAVDTRNINATSANNKLHGALFYRVADGTEGASFSFGLGGGTSASASNGASGAIVAFSGVDGTGGVQANGSPGGPFDVDPGTINVAGTGSAVTATGLTTVSSNAGIVMLGMVGGASQTWSSWNTTSPGALSEIAEVTRAGSSAAAAWAIQPAPGATGNGTASVSLTAQPPGALLVALKAFAPPGPVISSFTAAPQVITSGSSATLNWGVTGADTVSIDNGVGTVAGSGSVAVNPAATTTYTLSATNGLGTTTATATVSVVPPGPYRYYRFAPTALRNNTSANSVQISEFQMLLGGTRVGGATASNPGGNSPGGESAAQANDDNLGSKWLDFTKFTPLILDFGAAAPVDGYRIGTAGDADERDPVSWRVDASHNGTTWITIDTQTNYATPTDRQVYISSIPVNVVPGPVITFTATPGTIFTGGSSTLAWNVTGADPGGVSIDQGIGTVSASGSQGVSPASATTYTLSATGGGFTNTKIVTVNVVPPGSKRYFRFIPLALRNTAAADSVQIAEFQMLLGGVRIGGASASNPGGNSPGGESAQQGNDNDLNSKWLDFTKFTPLVLDFGTLVAADGYRWATAGDADERDPVSWRVEGSEDGATWMLLDERLNQNVTTARQTYLADSGFNHAPTFTGYTVATPYETAAGVSFGKILLIASDSDGDTLTVTAAGPASAQGGTAVLLAGSVLYTPANGFSGIDTFAVTISDGRGGSVSGTVTVNVAGNMGVGPNAPVITLQPGGSVDVAFRGIPGRSYEVQRSTDLTNWTVLATVTAGATGAVTFTDPSPPPSAGFYRMRQP
jgi:hypothetical protein